MLVIVFGWHKYQWRKYKDDGYIVHQEETKYDVFGDQQCIS